ncbi:MAG: MFS transporter [Chitinivibrionales bacterium]
MEGKLDSSALENAGGQVTGSGVPVLLISVCILILGNYLQNTLLGIRASFEGISSLNIGLMMSAYFVGFSIGPLILPPVIVSVGHIRTYAALASLASATALAYALIVFVPAWIVFRFLQGLFYAGMILIIESWLNGCSTSSTRGRLLATYGIVFWGSAAVSQTLLNIAPADSYILFACVSILLSITLAPITLAPSHTPATVFNKPLKLRRLISISPIGACGAMTSGLSNGAIWGLGPVFAKSLSADRGSISLFMAVIMGGALLSQWPLGRLSDSVDRRYVIVLSGITAGLIGLLLASQVACPHYVIIALVLLYGSFSIPLYSLSIAHVNDCVSDEERISTAGLLILLQGLGSAIGPLLAGAIMVPSGPRGLFFFVSFTFFIMAGSSIAIIIRRKPTPARNKSRHVPIPRISLLFHMQGKHGTRQKS